MHGKRELADLLLHWHQSNRVRRGRSISGGLRYFGFHAEGVIQPVVPLILGHYAAVPFTRDEVSARLATGDAKLAALLRDLLDEGSRTEGEAYDILLLTGADDPRTIRLKQPIVNDMVTESGKPWGWTLGQRYTSLGKLTSGVASTSEL